ncbi:Protein-tyrosine-phosphatase [Purpureocillium takamizusanense]|uniref:diphosphoinositol-polyphosphate diphosphatase n=1 Tax=Purpureocillium takamizusanense TaxID=2060973 RepID=A0A9Q8VHB9_9HYPO|nr:Protein-tyrosine-phosphatase [Purpureocillium takamizusanense]UNI24632.1 Protein-tyrosine-phosphatase [Purpureocillium takamizusanense]
MASKRNSRVFVDEAKHQEEGQQKTTMSRPRRDSRTSVKEDDFQQQLAQEMEEIPRGSTTTNESSSSASSASSISSLSRSQSINGTAWEPANAGLVWQLGDSLTTAGAVAFTHPHDFAHVPLGDRPTNFGVVVPGLYRSSYPKPDDYEFLQSLKLKTIVTLVKKDELDYDLNAFATSNGIRQEVFNMKGTKKEAIPVPTMKAILELVLDRRNHPLLIHCNHGKHRTGCVVAVIRKLSGWGTDTAVAEYKSYAEPKVRECDVEYISSFQATSLPLRSESARTSPVHIRTFFRTLVFSTLVLALWLVSSVRLTAAGDS